MFTIVNMTEITILPEPIIISTKCIQYNYINIIIFLSICFLITGSVLLSISHKDKLLGVILIIIGIPGSLIFLFRINPVSLS